MIRLRQAAILLSALLLAGGVFWLLGFAAFSQQARQKSRRPAQADGIVALTGGQDRIATALRLLQSGVAPVLLISGVSVRTELAELARRVQPDGASLTGEPWASRITLGHTAQSTAGNADEIAPWAREHDIHSLIVVTAGYHMARALLEIGRALPGVTLIPMRVQPAVPRGNADWGTLSLLANECDKWVVARLGLARPMRNWVGGEAG